MKILHVVHYFLPQCKGGTEVVTYSLSKTFQELGHQTAIFSREFRGARKNISFQGNFYENLQTFRVYSNQYRSLFGLGTYKNKKIDRLFSAVLDRFLPDVVHFHHLIDLSLDTIDECKKRDIPAFLTLHDFWLMCPQIQRYNNVTGKNCHEINYRECPNCIKLGIKHMFLERRRNAIKKKLGCLSRGNLLLIDRCLMLMEKTRPINVRWLIKREQYIKSKLSYFEKIFAPTPFLYDEFKKWGAPNLVFSEDAIETRLFENFKKDRNLEREIRFAFIGTLVPMKGVHVLIKAFNNIKEENIFLDIYGDRKIAAEYSIKLENLIKNKNIKFTGTFEINQVAEVFRRFDVLVVPALWYENAPLVIRNAILAKTPVIATDVGGMNFLIKDGENGLTCSLGDEKDLQEKIEKIIKNPRLIEIFSKNMPVIKNVVENVKELEEYYLQALQKRNRPPQTTTYPALDKYKYKVSIVIPTFNGADSLEDVITMIKKQTVDFSYEIVFVDSGSTDGTLEIIKKYNMAYYSISGKDFNHGLTRNFGISKTSGEIIVVLTQDTIPKDENWLRNIVKYYDDKDVAGVYVKQVPHNDCDYITAKRINESFIGRDKTIVNRISSFQEYANLSPFQKYLISNFDNVCGSFRRRFWEMNPYQKIDFGEDLRLGIDIILAGKKIVYSPDAQVIHSHNRDVIYVYKRCYLSHMRVIESYDLAVAPNKKVLLTTIKNLIKKDLKYIWRLQISFWKRVSLTFFLFSLDVITNTAAYNAFRDFQKGKIKSYKI